jgi:hypothetical protein
MPGHATARYAEQIARSMRLEDVSSTSRPINDVLATECVRVEDAWSPALRRRWRCDDITVAMAIPT